MKVDPNIQSILNAQSDAVQSSKTTRTQESNPESQTGQVDGNDTVQVSPKFAEVQQLTSNLQKLPDVRSEKVAALKEKIQQGTYKPSLSDVADALLNDTLGQGGKA